MPTFCFPLFGRHPGILNIMKIDIVSVFPEYFEVLNLSLLGKAQSKGLVEVTAHNLRDWTHDVHHSVDDTPVGGGAGMVMKPEVWSECLDELLQLEPAVIENTENIEDSADSFDTGDSCDTADSDTAQSSAGPENSEKTDIAPSSAGPVLIFRILPPRCSHNRMRRN